MATSASKSMCLMHNRSKNLLNNSKIKIDEASAFLKEQIGEIIKNQLKAFQMRNKLQGQLQQYHKQQENKKIAQAGVQDRVRNFREHEKNYRKKELENFQRRQKQRQQKLKEFCNRKQAEHNKKCSQINQTLEGVRQKYQNLANDDCQTRLSKLAPYTSSGSRINQLSRHSDMRMLSLSTSSSRVHIIKEHEKQLQQHKVTNYLSKIARSESRVLLKQIQNEKRRQSSLRKKVKCLVSHRKKIQEDKMSKTETDYKQRMQLFTLNRSKIIQKKENILMHKTMLNLRAREKIAQRRQQLRTGQIQRQFSQKVRIVTNFNLKGGRDKPLQYHRSILDLNYSENNRIYNLSRMNFEEEQIQYEKLMKYLINKIQSVKKLKLKDNDDIDLVNRYLSRMIKKDDPDYQIMMDFLKSERRTFLEGILKKEQQKNKLKKNGKNITKNTIM